MALTIELGTKIVIVAWTLNGLTQRSFCYSCLNAITLILAWLAALEGRGMARFRVAVLLDILEKCQALVASSIPIKSPIVPMDVSGTANDVSPRAAGDTTVAFVLFVTDHPMVPPLGFVVTNRSPISQSPVAGCAS